MKTLIFSFLMLITANCLYGQSRVANTENLFDLHSQTAMEQIGKYLSNNLSYPNSLKQYKVEGKALIEIKLNDEGELVSAKIVKSLHPEIDAVILKVARGLKSIDLNGGGYYGNKRIQFPISYKL